MKITSKHFATTRDGQEITEYILSCPSVQVSVLNYGGIIRSIIVPDKTGKGVDIALGYDNLTSYEEDAGSNFGALTGRFAGRIRESRFPLGNEEIVLPPNSGRHHLHGPFRNKVLQATVSGSSLILSGVSPAEEEGYPGDLSFSVTYTLSDDGILAMIYDADTTADTVVNLTNHSYFNLNGHNSGDILEQELQISASHILENTDELLPTGEILPVENTPFDFRQLSPIGKGFPVQGEQMEFAGGYDHCFLLDEDAKIAAIAHSRKTGITMEVSTTQPAVVFYSGNFLMDHPYRGKGGCQYNSQHGFRLETQHAPNSPNMPEFPTTTLKKGEHYHEATLLKFLTVK